MFEIKQQDKIEIFINSRQDVTMTQYDTVLDSGEEMSVISITYENLSYTIKALQLLKKELHLIRKG